MRRGFEAHSLEGENAPNVPKIPRNSLLGLSPSPTLKKCNRVVLPELSTPARMRFARLPPDNHATLSQAKFSPVSNLERK